MGTVEVEKVSIDSHIPTEELLKAAVSGRPLNVEFVADGGNGAIVNLTLKPTAMAGEVKDLLLEEEMQKRLESLDLEISDLAEDK